MSPASHAAAAFGVGFALGAAPGPVQVLLLTEASRGGVRRGVQAMAGANLTLAALGAVLALWLSGIEISPTLLRVVRVAGGLFLAYAGFDTIRAAGREIDDGAFGPAPGRASGPPPAVRGVAAVLLNPGALLFLATTGSALLASASADGGTPLAIATLIAMVAGVAAVDFMAVLVGSRGRRLPVRWRVRLFRGLGVLLIAIGAVFLAGAALG
ncbi:MAG TPA: LysE family transporter [Actinomycetota bacterium]